jgi:hypothetical protein
MYDMYLTIRLNEITKCIQGRMTTTLFTFNHVRVVTMTASASDAAVEKFEQKYVCTYEANTGI